MGNVLIIDDDELFCEMLSDMVQDMGHGVKSARTLEEGLEKAAAGGVDVVFLDAWRFCPSSGKPLMPRK